jgi:hypothetical protein
MSQQHKGRVRMLIHRFFVSSQILRSSHQELKYGNVKVKTHRIVLMSQNYTIETLHRLQMPKEIKFIRK